MNNKSKKADKPIKENHSIIPQKTSLPKLSQSLESTEKHIDDAVETDNEVIIKKAIASLKGKKLFEKQDKEADEQLDKSTFKISPRSK